jgi:hypothetical protein
MGHVPEPMGRVPELMGSIPASIIFPARRATYSSGKLRYGRNDAHNTE